MNIEEWSAEYTLDIIKENLPDCDKNSPNLQVLDALHYLKQDSLLLKGYLDDPENNLHFKKWIYESCKDELEKYVSEEDLK